MSGAQRVLIIVPWYLRGSTAGHGERDGTVYLELKTDSQGWPQIGFPSDYPELRLVGEFLQDDVGLLQAICDELMQGLKSVMQGREEEWVWNGDRFFVLVRKDITELRDKYGEDGVYTKPVLVETPLFTALADGWTHFVVRIPLQREFTDEKDSLTSDP